MAISCHDRRLITLFGHRRGGAKAHSNKECRPSSQTLLENVGASSELKALEEENRRCRAEARPGRTKRKTVEHRWRNIWVFNRIPFRNKVVWSFCVSVFCFLRENEGFGMTCRSLKRCFESKETIERAGKWTPLVWEALRNKQLADEYWQEMLQMKKQEFLQGLGSLQVLQVVLQCSRLVVFFKVHTWK